MYAFCIFTDYGNGLSTFIELKEIYEYSREGKKNECNKKIHVF